MDGVLVGQELYPAIAWLTTDGQMGGNKAQVTEGWRCLSGVMLETKGLVVGRYQGGVGDVATVEMTEVQDGETSLAWMKEGEGWRFILENALCTKWSAPT